MAEDRMQMEDVHHEEELSSSQQIFSDEAHNQFIQYLDEVRHNAAVEIKEFISRIEPYESYWFQRNPQHNQFNIFHYLSYCKINSTEDSNRLQDFFNHLLTKLKSPEDFTLLYDKPDYSNISNNPSTSKTPETPLQRAVLKRSYYYCYLIISSIFRYDNLLKDTNFFNNLINLNSEFIKSKSSNEPERESFRKNRKIIYYIIIDEILKHIEKLTKAGLNKDDFFIRKIAELINIEVVATDIKNLDYIYNSEEHLPLLQQILKRVQSNDIGINFIHQLFDKIEKNQLIKYASVTIPENKNQAARSSSMELNGKIQSSKEKKNQERSGNNNQGRPGDNFILYAAFHLSCDEQKAKEFFSLLLKKLEVKGLDILENHVQSSTVMDKLFLNPRAASIGILSAIFEYFPTEKIKMLVFNFSGKTKPYLTLPLTNKYDNYRLTSPKNDKLKNILRLLEKIIDRLPEICREPLIENSDTLLHIILDNFPSNKHSKDIYERLLSLVTPHNKPDKRALKLAEKNNINLKSYEAERRSESTENTRSRGRELSKLFSDEPNKSRADRKELEKIEKISVEEIKPVKRQGEDSENSPSSKRFKPRDNQERTKPEIKILRTSSLNLEDRTRATNEIHVLEKNSLMQIEELKEQLSEKSIALEKTKTELNKDVTEEPSAVDELQSQLMREKKENEKLRTIQENLLRKIKNMKEERQKENERLYESKTSSEQKIKKLEDAVASERTVIESLQTTKSNLEKEKHELQIEKIESDKVKEEAIQNLTKEKEQHSQEIEMLKKENEQLHESGKRSEQKIKELEIAVANNDLILTKEKDELVTLKIANAESTQKLTEVENQYSQKIEALKNEINNLNHEKIESDKVNEGKIKELTKERDRHLQKIQELKKDNELLKKSKQSLDQRAEKFKGIVTKKNTAIKNLRTTNAKLEEEKNKLQNEIVELNGVNQKITQEFTEEKIKYLQKIEELKDISEEHTNFKELFKKLTEKSSKWQNEPSRAAILSQGSPILNTSRKTEINESKMEADEHNENVGASALKKKSSGLTTPNESFSFVLTPDKFAEVLFQNYKAKKEEQKQKTMELGNSTKKDQKQKIMELSNSTYAAINLEFNKQDLEENRTVANHPNRNLIKSLWSEESIYIFLKLKYSYNYVDKSSKDEFNATEDKNISTLIGHKLDQNGNSYKIKVEIHFPNINNFAKYNQPEIVGIKNGEYDIKVIKTILDNNSLSREHLSTKWQHGTKRQNEIIQPGTKEKLIDAKATSKDKKALAGITKNEWKTIQQYNEIYHIYRIYNTGEWNASLKIVDDLKTKIENYEILESIKVEI